MNAHYKFLEAYYESLLGATINKVVIGEDGWLQLEMKLSDGSSVTAEVSSDTEGNNPGFIHGLPMPTKPEKG